MRLIRTPCIALLLLLLAAAPAQAENVETDGFSVKVPLGYRKLLDSETSGGNFSFPMMDTFLDGEPEIKTFIKGSFPEPDAAIVAIYMPMKGDQSSISDAELGTAGDQLGNMLGQGFSMKKQTFQGEYEGIIIRCQLEDIPTAQGVEGEFRIALIACGDYAVFLGLVNFNPDVGTESDLAWDQMLGTLKIDPPTNWMTLLLILLSCSSAIIFIFRVLLKKPPQISYAGGPDRSFGPQGTDTGGRAMDGLPAYGQEPAPPLLARAETAPPPNANPSHLPSGNALPSSAPGGLSDPLATPPAPTQPPTPPPRKPAPAGTDAGPGGGLRSTLPASGRWSDQFKNK